MIGGYLKAVISYATCLAIGHVSSALSPIALGALFDVSRVDVLSEVAFHSAIDRVNSGMTRSSAPISPQVERVISTDGFHTAKRLCQMMKVGVAAVLGPQDASTAAHVQSVCDAKSLPHIATSWHMLPGPPHSSTGRGFSINLHPHWKALSKAYSDIVQALRWHEFFLLYESNESLSRLQEVLKIPDSGSKVSMLVRQLPDHDDIRPLLKSIQNAGGTHIVVDCSTSRIGSVLRQAQQIGMITRFYHYFFTSLDLHTVDLVDFQFAGTNITGVRLVDINSMDVMLTVDQWKKSEIGRDKLDKLPVTKLSTEAALVYDAVLLFARAADDLHGSRDIGVTSLDCQSDDLWPHGESLLNYMKLVEVDGLSGHVQFDTHGVRSQFQLQIVSLSESGLRKVGEWTSQRGVVVTDFNNSTSHRPPSIENQNLVVTTLLKRPYTMLKISSDSLRGNDRYEGICVDLLDELSRALHFNYTLHVNAAGAPGQFNSSSGRWTGMIGELLDGTADLAVADLTITSEREAVVDFTMQFMNLGISILYRKPTRQPPSLFSFLSPLSLYVWLYMAAATMGVAILMFVLARFTPYEWEKPHPCASDQDTLQNNFNMHNCVWFCIGSLMQQGCDFLPKAMSTRMVAGIWWFFTLIMIPQDLLSDPLVMLWVLVWGPLAWNTLVVMSVGASSLFACANLISSYTANLAAFLTVERMVSPIESAEDLASQNKIKYGVYEKGSTAAFFKNSQVHPYNKMWQSMYESKPSVFLDSEAGIRRVIADAGQYAYFMESSTIEYVVERECELTQIGGLLDNKGYGIALPPGSPWTKQLSQHLLYMQEHGQLTSLKNRWWNYHGNQCNDESGGSMASELDLENVGGVFVCLLGGMLVATTVAMLEFVYHQRTTQSPQQQTSLLAAMCGELRAILHFRGSTRPNTASHQTAATGGATTDSGSRLTHCAGATFSTDCSSASN